MTTPEQRLAVYGTLAPGRANAHALAGLKGVWRDGAVRGRLLQAGWGAAQGFPGIVLDPAGDRVPVRLFESADLPAHWARLDAFEGAEYTRRIVSVETADGVVDASIYTLATADSE